MAGKKSMNATKKLPEGEPTQVTPAGLKIGLPSKGDVLSALKKVAHSKNR